MRRLLPYLSFLFLFLGTAGFADSPWIYGIHWYGNQSSSDVEAMTGGKSIWVLETVMLYDGGWTMNDQASKFQAVANKGHTVVIRIQPRWGWSIPAPAERAQYLNDIEAAAQQAANFCHIWQIGNEMNLYDEYGGGVLGAQEYIDFYKQIRARIKNVTSPLGEQIVLVGPVSPGAYFQEVRHTEGLDYLGQMCDNLGPGDTDGFALHAYGAPWLDSAGARADLQNGYASQLGVIDSKGFCDKPAYILEWNRQTTPTNDAYQEQQTAQFIIGAYQDLQAWNADPNNHPVVCATWFIYPDSPGWEIFSLLHLRGQNARGVNLDVWDSFQYACSLNINAGSQAPSGCSGSPNEQVTNGSFENGFTNGVGNGWTSWTKSGSSTITFGKTSFTTFDGDSAQYWARSDSNVFTGGVYQRVATVPGERYAVTAYMRRYPGATTQQIKFGYDLDGGTDPLASSIVYSDLTGGGSNTWIPYTATVDATGDYITLFAYGGHTTTDGASNYYYLDSVSMISDSPIVLEAEDFDNYFDTTTGNTGGQYRSTDVDIEVCSEGGYNVGWTAAGEWLEFVNVTVPNDGTYQVDARVASASAGGNFHVEVGGQDQTGTITFPATGGWQTWSTVSAGEVTLNAGNNTIRLVLETGDWNINHLTLTRTGNSSPPPPSNIDYIKIEAEDFDTGANGTAYYDTDAGNTGGAYRSTDVDIETASEGGYNVGWIAAGEWLKFSGVQANAASYRVDVRIASHSAGGTLHLDVNGVDATGPVSFGATGGWQTWTTITAGYVTLAEGSNNLRLVMDAAGWNVNYIEFTKEDPPPPSSGLVNGSFENGFTNGVGNGWTSWSSGWSNAITFGQTGFTKHDGSYAQYWSRSDAANFNGGVYQVVSVTPGKDYRITAWMLRRAGSNDQWMEFGYDLTGATDPEGSSPVYTKLEGAGTDVWVQYDQIVTATGNAITLFAKGGHWNGSGSGNYFYLDEVALTQLN